MSFLATTVMAGGLAVLTTGPASALGSESLGCIIEPSNATAVTQGFCSTQSPGSSYSASYVVLNGSGSYSYAWTVPLGRRVINGCTSSSSNCVLSVQGTAADQWVAVSVVISQNGASETLSAQAFFPAVCGDLC
jgi:hypothetical protein